MKGYVIMARENWPGAQIKEICRCNGFPQDIRNALADYTITGSQGTRIYKYNHVEILDLAPLKKKEVAQMKYPDRNVKPISDATCAQLEYIFRQIDALRAEDGVETAKGAAAKARPTLSQRQSEDEL